MTMFMVRLAEAIGGEPPELPMPSLRPSTPSAFIVGGDRHVALRSLGEQLVCEANAVIADPSSRLLLTDDVGGDALEFTIACQDHRARVTTQFTGGVATGQIFSDDLPQGEPQELAGPEALPDLIIRLCLIAGVRNHQSAHLN